MPLSYIARSNVAREPQAPAPTGLWRFLSYLDRPWQTVANPVHALLDPADVRGPLRAGWEGLTGQREIRGRDLLERLDVPELGSVGLPLIGEVTGRGALGFALEAKADPLKLLKIGKLTPKGVKARARDFMDLHRGKLRGARVPLEWSDQARQGMRSLFQVRVPGTQSHVSLLPRALDEKAVGTLGRAGQRIRGSWAGQLFGQPYSRDPMMHALQRAGGVALKGDVQNRLAARAAPIVKDIYDLERRLSIPYKELAPSLTELIERGYNANRFAARGLITDRKVIEQLRPIVRKFRAFNELTYRYLKRSGVPVERLDPELGLHYIRHVADESTVPKVMRDSINLYSLDKGKSRVRFWKMNQKQMLEAAKENPRLLRKGRLYKGAEYIPFETTDQLMAEMAQGAEFRISASAFDELIGTGKTQKKLVDKLGIRQGASSIMEQNMMIDQLNLPHQARLIPDPIVSAAATSAKAGRQVASANIARAVARNTDWALPAAQAPKHWKSVGKQFGGILKKMKVSPEIYNELTRTIDPQKIEPAIEPLIRTIGEATGWWKAFTLATPAYDVRNAITNIFFHNIYGGNTSVKMHKNAAKAMIAGLGLEGANRTMLHDVFSKIPFFNYNNFMRGSVVKGYSNREIYKLARKYGVISNDMLGRAGLLEDLSGHQPARGTDLARRTIEGQAGRVAAAKHRLNPIGREGPISRNMNVIHGTVEGQGRMALFMDGLNKGMSPAEAAMNVTKWHLDYAPESLSAFERNYLQKIIPFYKFLRRNTANHLELLLSEPGKLGLTARPLQVAKRDIPEHERELMPSWWREGLPLKFEDDPETGQSRFADLRNYVPLDTPIAQLLSGYGSPRRAMEGIIGGLSPTIKLPFEYGTGISTFSGRPIERFPGEPGEYLGMPVTRMQQHLARSLFRPAKELDQLNPLNMFGEDRFGRWEQPGQADRTMAFITGFRSMILDEQARRRQVSIEEGRRRGRIQDSKQRIMQHMRNPHVANNPLLRFFYHRAYNALHQRSSDITGDIETLP